MALITLHHATAKDLHMSFLRPLYYPRRGHSFFYLTFENIFNIMCIESERGTENPFQVSPCATGWPVRVVFSTTDEQQEKESCNAACDTLGWFDSGLELLFSLDI